MATDSKPSNGLSELLDPARQLVDLNKKVYIDRHEYRPATEADFAGRDRGWYDTTTRELESLDFTAIGDIVNVTIEKAANLRAVVRRFVSKDATTMAAIYQFVQRHVNLRICELESELSDASFITTGNSEASKAVSMPPQIVSEKLPVATTPKQLVKAHRATQKKHLKGKKHLSFVPIRTADEYQAAQHRQEAIKAAFRAGFNYLDPAEVRRIAEQKSPNDPTTAALATAVADIARRPVSPLETMMNAIDGGDSMESVGKLFAEQLLAKENVPAEARQGIAETVSSLFQSAESGSHDDGLKNLFTLMGKLQDLEPPEEKKARQEQAKLNLERLVADQKKWEARHRKKRLEKGLSETAGTGQAEPMVPLYAKPLADLAVPDESLTIREHVKAIEAAKRSRDEQTLAGLPVGASRVGGLPDLPTGVEWPSKGGKRLPFIAQIDLSQFKPKTKGLLPARGHLYAFALLSNEKRHRPTPVVVLLPKGSTKSLVRATVNKDTKIWPDWTGENVYELLPAAPTRPRRKKGSDEKAARPMAYLGGKMDGGYGTPGELADGAFLDGDDWINLLAVHSVGSMQWSDSGDLYLIIRRSALKKLDFSNVYATACSS